MSATPRLARPSSATRVPAVLAVVAIAGCAAPAIEVRSATVEASGSDATQLAIVVDMRNPADEPMRLLQWNYTFTSGGRSYSGRWEALETLPPKSTTSVRIPAVLAGTGFDAGAWNVSGSVSYRSPSRFAKILYDLDLSRPRSGFAGGSASVASAASGAGGSDSAVR